jgi:hypothetical protein
MEHPTQQKNPTNSTAISTDQRNSKRNRGTAEETRHHGSGCSGSCGQGGVGDGEEVKGAGTNSDVMTIDNGDTSGGGEDGDVMESARKRRQTHHPSEDTSTHPSHRKKLKRLKLEAIFHPKFENETSDKDIRNEMLTRINGGEGYLEVTLKHSGSLLLWYVF